MEKTHPQAKLQEEDWLEIVLNNKSEDHFC